MKLPSNLHYDEKIISEMSSVWFDPQCLPHQMYQYNSAKYSLLIHGIKFESFAKFIFE